MTQSSSSLSPPAESTPSPAAPLTPPQLSRVPAEIWAAFHPFWGDPPRSFAGLEALHAVGVLPTPPTTPLVAGTSPATETTARSAAATVWTAAGPRPHLFTWDERRVSWRLGEERDLLLLGPWLRPLRPPAAFLYGYGQSYMDGPMEANCLQTYLRRLLNRSLSPPDRRVAAPLVLLSEGLWTNWFHWLLEQLPRLTRLDWADPAWRIAVPEAAAPFVAESLALLGLEGRIEPIAGEVIACDHVVFPAPLADRPQPAFDTVPWLRQAFLPRLGARSDAGRRLYVTRRDAPSRRILNEGALLAHLRLLGFEVLTLSATPVVDQMRAFAEAELIVAPHGAGLVNLAFCRPGVRVVEIVPTGPGAESFFSASFPQISAVVGLDHHILLVPGDPNQDMRVDPELVLAVLAFEGLGAPEAFTAHKTS